VTRVISRHAPSNESSQRGRITHPHNASLEQTFLRLSGSHCDSSDTELSDAGL